MHTLRQVLQRVYHEGVESERTNSAEHLIASSTALRSAVERGDPAAARAAAQALIATGHMTRLEVSLGARTLVSVGGPALAPLRGSITGAGGSPIATYTASVWSDRSFVNEAEGISRTLVSLRAAGVHVAGSRRLPQRRLAAEGRIGSLQYTSFPAEAFTSGPVRVYAARTLGSLAGLCGPSEQDTMVNTLKSVAEDIYAGEAGARTHRQTRRVQRNRPLLQAVARRDPLATRTAIEALLHQHIVRLRAIAGAQTLADVGGPDVLAPVTAPLRLGGRRIGSVVLSIQDDEGYLRLTRRLAGLDVLMYMDGQLVKNSLGPAPGAVPASGPYTYRGRSFRVFTVDARAFPSGTLTIRVLVPLPYL